MTELKHFGEIAGMPACSPAYKFRGFVLFMALYGVFYVVPNFFSQAPAHQLPMLWIDQNTPFLPWTFIFYTSDYFVFVSTIILHKTKETFDAFVRMMIMTLVICGFFFHFYPTIYPRPEYLPQANFFIQFLMDIIANFDSPRNCFPSMHVALTGVATWSLRYKGPKTVALFSFWSLLVYVSTLTTKQHYFMDVMGGLCVLGIVTFANWLVFERKYFPSVTNALRRWNA